MSYTVAARERSVAGRRSESASVHADQLGGLHDDDGGQLLCV